MIDYEEELKKFEPCLDVKDTEGAIYERELTDILEGSQEQQAGKITKRKCSRAYLDAGNHGDKEETPRGVPGCQKSRQ